MAKTVTQPQEKVTLETVNPVGGKHNKKVTRDFDYEHAKSLLNYEKAKNIKEWQLPANSKFIFQNGDLIQRGGAQADQGAPALTGNPSSEGKEDQA